MRFLEIDDQTKSKKYLRCPLSIAVPVQQGIARVQLEFPGWTKKVIPRHEYKRTDNITEIIV